MQYSITIDIRGGTPQPQSTVLAATTTPATVTTIGPDGVLFALLVIVAMTAYVLASLKSRVTKSSVARTGIVTVPAFDEDPSTCHQSCHTMSSESEPGPLAIFKHVYPPSSPSDSQLGFNPNLAVRPAQTSEFVPRFPPVQEEDFSLASMIYAEMIPRDERWIKSWIFGPTDDTVVRCSTPEPEAPCSTTPPGSPPATTGIDGPKDFRLSYRPRHQRSREARLVNPSPDSPRPRSRSTVTQREESTGSSTWDLSQVHNSSTTRPANPGPGPTHSVSRSSSHSVDSHWSLSQVHDSFASHLVTPRPTASSELSIHSGTSTRSADSRATGTRRAVTPPTGKAFKGLQAWKTRDPILMTSSDWTPSSPGSHHSLASIDLSAGPSALDLLIEREQEAERAYPVPDYTTVNSSSASSTSGSQAGFSQGLKQRTKYDTSCDTASSSSRSTGPKRVVRVVRRPPPRPTVSSPTSVDDTPA